MYCWLVTHVSLTNKYKCLNSL